MNDEQRLFFALWPPQEAAQSVHAWANDVRRDAGGRAIAAPNIHLTLAFIGEVDDARARELAEIGGAVRAEPFELALDEARYWAHNRIVWAGPSKAPEALLMLVRRLCAELAGAGYKTDTRPYQAHITLVRDASPPSVFRAPPAQRFRVEEFLLVRSELSSRGPTYSVQQRYALANPARSRSA